MLIVSRQYRLIWTCWNFEVAFWSPRFHHPFGVDCSCSSALGSLQKILTTSWELHLGIEVFYLAPMMKPSYQHSILMSLIKTDHIICLLSPPCFEFSWIIWIYIWCLLQNDCILLFFFPLHPHTSSCEGIKHHEWIKQLVSSLCEVRDHVVQGCRPRST